MVDNSNALVSLNQICGRLALSDDVDELKGIRDQAEAVRTFAKNARLGLELQNRAAEVKLRAERRAGQLLSAMKLRGGDRRSNGRSDRLYLSDLGISQNQSKRWQRLASISERDFADYVSYANLVQSEITTAALIRQAGSGHATPAARPSTRPAPLRLRPLLENLAELARHQESITKLVAIEESDPLKRERLARLASRFVNEMRSILDEIDAFIQEHGTDAP